MTHDVNLWANLARYAVAAVAGWGGLFFRRWNKRRIENAAQGWSSIEARVVTAVAKPVPKTTRYLVTLNYTFFVDEYRSGEYCHEFNREDDADDFARQMRDRRLQVRYDQRNPNRSVLEQSVVEQMVLLAPRFG